MYVQSGCNDYDDILYNTLYLHTAQVSSETRLTETSEVVLSIHTLTISTAVHTHTLIDVSFTVSVSEARGTVAFEAIY